MTDGREHMTCWLGGSVHRIQWKDVSWPQRSAQPCGVCPAEGTHGQPHCQRVGAPREATHAQPGDGYSDLCLVQWKQTPWGTLYDGQRLRTFLILQMRDWGTNVMGGLKKDLGARAPQTWLGSPQVLREVNTDKVQKPWVTSILHVPVGFH